MSNYGTDLCHGNFNNQCVRGAHDRTPHILMTGDSHAAMLNAFVDVVGVHNNWSAKVVTASSCSPVFGYDETVLPDWAQPPCNDLKHYIKTHYGDYDAVFFASFWAYQLGMTSPAFDADFKDKLRTTLAIIAKTTPVYVFSDDPHLSIDPLRAARFQRLGFSIHRPASDISQRANAIVRGIVTDTPGAHWVDLSSYYDKFSNGVYDGDPTYFDKQHLNVYGSRALGQLFVSAGATIME